jgi:hypothetical protein
LASPSALPNLKKSEELQRNRHFFSEVVNIYDFVLIPEKTDHDQLTFTAEIAIYRREKCDSPRDYSVEETELTHPFSTRFRLTKSRQVSARDICAEREGPFKHETVHPIQPVHCASVVRVPLPSPR